MMPPAMPVLTEAAPMVLGIAIDDTVHYFSRFSRDIKRFADDRKATLSALKAVEPPFAVAESPTAPWLPELPSHARTRTVLSPRAAAW